MKNLILQLALFCFLPQLKAQIVNIPDAAFKRELLTQGIDENGDGEIQIDEAQKVTVLYVTKQQIKDLNGIDHFLNQEELGCYGNEIKYLDVSRLKKLQRLYAMENLLESINITGLMCLKDIFLQNNPNLCLNIDFSQFQLLEELQVNNTRTPKLNLKNLKNLKIVEASNSMLNEIAIDGSLGLEQLWLGENQLDTIDFRELPKLKFIRLSNNPIKSVDIRQLKSLKQFSCLDCYALKQINTSGCENLEPILW
ncbi:MAG: hypothetical protein R2814_12395 [Flavobacteriaceae bacterium]